MINHAPSKPLYPKSHLLAASGVAAVLSLVLLMFPSREVEAKKSLLDYNFDAAVGSLKALEDDLREAVETEAHEALESDEAPFPQTPDVMSPQGSNAARKEQSTADGACAGARQAAVHKDGESLKSVIARAGFSGTALQSVLAATKTLHPLEALHAGQVLVFCTAAHGALSQVRVQQDKQFLWGVEQTAKGFRLVQQERASSKAERRAGYAAGVINSSLVAAVKEAGLGYAVAMDLANIFGYDIDFALDLQKGDTFEVLFVEQSFHNGHNTQGIRKILAARFVNQGKAYTAVRYKPKGGTEAFYNAEGLSLRKAFIRTPVDVARISSGFSLGRRHPILNKIRAHKGVDYAAPTGTPIKSAGAGQVVQAGRSGGYGNTLIVQHGQRYRTLYAHMQGFAKGIREGVNVKQGQIIGYIGTTGLSTGPHLHYEFQVDGQHVDPLSQSLSMTNTMAGVEKGRFLQFSRTLLARMDQEKSVSLAVHTR